MAAEDTKVSKSNQTHVLIYDLVAIALRIHKTQTPVITDNKYLWRKYQKRTFPAEKCSKTKLYRELQL